MLRGTPVRARLSARAQTWSGGRVRFIAAALKAAGPQGPGGSNPSRSAQQLNRAAAQRVNLPICITSAVCEQLNGERELMVDTRLVGVIG